MMRKSQNKEAFTLIEVLVAMLILAIGLLGLAGITVVVLRSNLLSQQMSEASNIASSLIEDIRRQQTLTDCDSANVLTVTGSCDILTQSGVTKVAGNALMPSLQNDRCAISVLGGTNAVSFDAISANLQTRSDFAMNADLCDVTNTPAGSPYIRYYRVYRPADATTANEHAIIAVVLWKDKYGKWRKVSFDTRRTDGS